MRGKAQKSTMGKKGVVYTLAFTLFALGLLSLAVLFSRHAALAESRHVELSFSQKVYDLDTSIQNILAEAFIGHSGMMLSSNRSLNASSMTLQENLSSDFAELDALLGRIKDGVEKDFSSVNISLEAFFSTHAVVLQPQGIVYKHRKGNSISVMPHPGIAGYEITLLFRSNITSCTAASEEEAEKERAVTLTFLGQHGGENCTFSGTGLESADITMIVGGKGVALELEEGGELMLESNATVQSAVKVLVAERNQSGYFEIPVMVEIRDPAFSFSKAGSVQIR